MLYLSQVLGRPIRDLEGERVATVKDVIVRLGEQDHPPVTGLVARFGRREFFLSRWRITELNEHGVRLNSDKLNLRPFVRREGEVLLARNVLDKQLIDVDGKRVVRVNDVQLIDVAGDWRVTGADVSLQGLWRRLAPAGFMGTRKPVEVIDWSNVGYLGDGWDGDACERPPLQHWRPANSPNCNRAVIALHSRHVLPQPLGPLAEKCPAIFA